MPDEKTLSETDIQTVVDHPFGGKKNVIMDSQILTTLMSCPRLTDLRFNHNLQSMTGKSNSLETGSIVHTFLEVYYKMRIAGEPRDRAIQYGFAAAELYIRGCKECTNFIPTEEQPKPSCNHKPNEYIGVRNTPKDNEGYKVGWKWALDTCDQYMQYYKNDPWVPLEVETVKGDVLYEDDDVRVLWKAKLDLIADTNQGIFPIDHKTMKQRRDQLSLNNQFTGQCLLMKTQNVIINKIGFQQTLKPEEKFLRTPVSFSRSRLLEWQGEILPFYAKLLLMYSESGQFPPNYTHCENKYGKCAFVKVCEADPYDRERLLKQDFIVGPEWNPVNDDDD